MTNPLLLYNVACLLSALTLTIIIHGHHSGISRRRCCWGRWYWYYMYTHISIRSQQPYKCTSFVRRNSFCSSPHCAANLDSYVWLCINAFGWCLFCTANHCGWYRWERWYAELVREKEIGDATLNLLGLFFRPCSTLLSFAGELSVWAIMRRRLQSSRHPSQGCAQVTRMHLN